MAVLRSGVSSQVGADSLSKYMSQWLNELDVTSQFRTCVSCNYFENDRRCTVFNRDPPGSIIVTGCDRYNDHEEIPF